MKIAISAVLILLFSLLGNCVQAIEWSTPVDGCCIPKYRKLAEYYEGIDVDQIFRGMAEGVINQSGPGFERMHKMRVESCFKGCTTDIVFVPETDSCNGPVKFEIGMSYLIILNDEGIFYPCTRLYPYLSVPAEGRTFLDCKAPCYENSKKFLRMCSSELFSIATDGTKIGSCSIQIGGGACDLYVKNGSRSLKGQDGWPRATDGSGTGCVRAPDFPRSVNKCNYESSEYDLTPTAVASFCTVRGEDNAVSQLKHAIKHDKCGLCKRKCI